MRYEVQKQIEKIDNALGTITLYQIPNMKITQEEMCEALQKAESCMRWVMHELCRQNKTMKEIYWKEKVVSETEKENDYCEWFKYDYRTIAPRYHDVNNPYWRIPENMDKLKYCPYCGKEIRVID